MKKDKTQTPVHETPNIFSTPRKEGESNLVKLVADILRSNGIEESKVNRFLAAREIVDAYGLCHEAQMFLMNRFFVYELSKSEVSAIEAKSGLVNNYGPDVWLSQLNVSVVPFIKKHNLL